MTNLELFMEYLTALVFLCAGFSKIVAFQCKSIGANAGRVRPPFSLPSACILAVGLFEVVAALALVIPSGPWPQDTIASVAAVALAFLTGCAIVYRVRRRQSVEFASVMFMLALFVAVARLV